MYQDVKSHKFLSKRKMEPSRQGLERRSVLELPLITSMVLDQSSSPNQTFAR